MWYLVYFGHCKDCYIKQFYDLGHLHRYIDKNSIKVYKICESLNIFL